MTFQGKTYRQIAQDILTKICGGKATEEFTFVGDKAIYRLENGPVTEVQRVAGTNHGVANKIFVKGSDYQLVNDTIEWLGGGKHPDHNTVFAVDYTIVTEVGISDVHPGSVVRTIVEAISREIESLYLQMEQAYLSGFLDTATGKALDLVVAILGLERKPPQPSSGFVTMGRNTNPEILTVSGEVHLYDGSPSFPLSNPLVKNITKLEGTCRGSLTAFDGDVDYELSRQSIVWLPAGKKPDAKTVFRVDYSAYRQIVIPSGMNIATFSLRPEETRLFMTVEEKTLVQTSYGKWEVEVPVVASVAGRVGNVLAGAVVVMPQPILGVEYVINRGDITNGVEVEHDYELRERAKHALEFAGKATYASLESAIRSVEGVRSLLIEDMPDNVAGIVKVIVDGGNIDQINQIINDTRAAGIRVEVFRPEIVYINLMLTLVVKKTADKASVVEEAEKRIRGYVSSLGIGDDILFSRIVESVVSIEGVWDVRDVVMAAYRTDGTVSESEAESVEINNEERAEPRTINISYEEIRV
jgi:uncharacterized phage protein gp47/JayE